MRDKPAVSGGGAPRRWKQFHPLVYSVSIYLFIYSFSFVCSRSKICLLPHEKCAYFYLRVFIYFATFIFKFRVPLGLPSPSPNQNPAYSYESYHMN